MNVNSGSGFYVTVDWINRNSTPAGGYKHAQLRAIGVPIPPMSGWPIKAAGKLITEEQKLKFESFHHGFKATKKSKNAMAFQANPLLPVLKELLNYCYQLEDRLGISSDQVKVRQAILHAESDGA